MTGGGSSACNHRHGDRTVSRGGLDVSRSQAEAYGCRNKRLVYQILSFLSASLSDGSIRTDDAEGIEIASQCISEAFDVDLAKAEDKAAYALPKGESLASILEKHVQNSAKSTPAAVETPAAVAASAEDKAKAEKAKLLGNQKMAAKDYDGAIAAYGDAIALDGRNSVYWSNRSVSRSVPADLTDSLCSVPPLILPSKLTTTLSPTLVKLSRLIPASPRRGLD